MIADIARTLPHTLRRVDAGDDTLAELEMLVGCSKLVTSLRSRPPGISPPTPAGRR